MTAIRKGWQEFFGEAVGEATPDEERWLEAIFYAGAVTVLNEIFRLSDDQSLDTAAKLDGMHVLRLEIAAYCSQVVHEGRFAVSDQVKAAFEHMDMNLDDKKH